MDRSNDLPQIPSLIRKCCIAFFVASMLALAGVLMTGCEPRVTSPISGAEVTGHELMIEAQKEERRATLEFEQKAEAADKTMREAKKRALVRANAIAANVDQSKAEADRLLAELRITTEADISGAEADLDRAKAAFSEAVAALETDTNAALAEAERKRQTALGAFSLLSKIPVVGQAAAAAGVDPNAIGSLLFGGALSGGLMSWRARKRDAQQTQQTKTAEDSAWDAGFKAAQEQAEQARAREHAAWEEAQRSILLLHTTPPSNSGIGASPTG